jgi:predicted permease
MENFLTVATQVAVLFALMGAGVVCRRAKLVDEGAVKGMVNVLLLIVTPSLIVDVFQRPYDPEMIRSLGSAFAVAVVVHIVMIAVTFAAIRHRSESTRTVLRVSAVFSNAGFMGIPLEQAILGDRGVFFGVMYVVVFNLLMWSWGLRVMGGKSDLRMMLVNPGTVGLAAGLPLFFLSVRLPAVLSAPIGMLADLNTPLAMIVTGYYLAGARLGKVLTAPAAYVAGFLRLVACPLLVIGLLMPLRGLLDRDMMLAVVIPASAPAAAMVTMFASKFSRDVDMAVGTVSATTLLSMVTMPSVIALAMELM